MISNLLQLKNQTIYRCAIVVLFFSFVTCLNAQPGTIDESFNTADIGFDINNGADNIVYCTAVQTDGKILIGGKFNTYDGISRNFIARLNQDGSIDETFDTGIGFDWIVAAIGIQTDGKIVVGGNFSTFNGIAREGLARLEQDGSLDLTFDPGSGVGGTNSTIKAIAIDANQKIIIGGKFASYNGMSRNSIARINNDGTIDTSFDPGTGISGLSSPQVNVITIQSDNKIIIGGNFNNYNGALRNSCVRINTDGSTDLTFDTGAGGSTFTTAFIYSINITNSNKVLISGTFSSYNNITINDIALLNSDGSIDTAFNPGEGVPFGITISTSAILLNGKIVVSGWFTKFDNIPYKRIALLNSDGSLDSAFDGSSGFDNYTNCSTLQADGKLILAGDFNSYQGISRGKVVRILENGNIDPSFHPELCNGANAIVNVSVIQPDQKIIIAGKFSSFGGETRSSITRLNSDGTNDSSFDSGEGTDNEIKSIAMQTDGKILIGGYFNNYRGNSVNGVARLNSDGSFDNTFLIDCSSYNIESVAIQSDGKILVGGSLNTTDVNSSYGIARFNQDGTQDLSFSTGTGTDSDVLYIHVQSNGQILLGGYFNSYNDTAVNYLVRLNQNGTIDSTFNIGDGPDDYVNFITTDENGRILIGGVFYAVDGNNTLYIARLNMDGSYDNTFASNIEFDDLVNVIHPLSDGNVLIGGWFSTCNTDSISRIACLKDDGTLNTLFDVGAGFNKRVQTIAIQNDSKIVIGGDFTSYNSIGKNRIIRLNGFEDETSLTVNENRQGANSLRISPNPSQGIFNFAPSIENIKNIEVFSIQGEKLNASLNQTNSQLDLSSYENGIYTVIITFDNGKQFQKIILNK